MNRLAKLLLVASIALLLTGIGLAVAQPGGLGDDDLQATPAGETTTTVDDDDEQAAGTTTTTTTAPTTSTPPTDTTAPTDTTDTTSLSDGVGSGSGVGSDGSGSGDDDSDDLADTGGESLILLGLALGAAGMVLRREHTA